MPSAVKEQLFQLIAAVVSLSLAFGETQRAEPQSDMTYDHSFEEPTPPVDPRDEAYTEACEKIDRLRARLYTQLEDVARGIAKEKR